MKTLKIIYYRRKVKEAVAYAKYWGDKAIASLPNMEKWTACIDHMMYWLCKSIEYAVSANKEGVLTRTPSFLRKNNKRLYEGG